MKFEYLIKKTPFLKSPSAIYFGKLYIHSQFKEIMQHPEITNERKEKAFFEAIEKMAQEVKKRDDFVVIHHHDADGCASGAIAIKALEREGKKVACLCLKQLYRENLLEIKALGKNYLFVDFGSGQMDYLKEEFKENFFVLDHHQPVLVNGKIVEHKWHVNPLLFGINGGTELSGTGVAFFFALALNKKNTDLSALGVVGALGDMQDFNSSSALIGMNRKIIEIAVKEKLLEVKKDLRLYGRISRPLISFLMFSSNPIIPGITASEDNCKALLQELNIPLKDPFTEQWLSYEDLPQEKKQALTSALIMNLAEHETPEWKIKGLIGEVYTLLKEAPKSPLRDGKEFATLLNACIVEDTLITDSYGRVSKVCDFASKSVFSLDENKTFNPDFVMNKHVPKIGDAKIFEIKTEYGKKLGATFNHEVLCFDSQLNWKRMEEIREGDYVAVAKRLPFSNNVGAIKTSSFFEENEIIRQGNLFKQKKATSPICDFVLDDDFFEFFGFVLGDGYISKSHHIDLAFHKSDKDIAIFKKMKKILKKFSPSQKFSVSEKENSFNASFGNATLHSILYKLGVPTGAKSSKITLHKALPYMQLSSVKACIKGLFESDGYLSNHPEYSSHSKIAYEVQSILLFFGIKSTIIKAICKDCGGIKYRLFVNSGDNANTFFRAIFDIEKKLPSPIKLNYPGASKLLLKWSKFYGVPPKYSSNFTYYSKGKNVFEKNFLIYKKHFKEKAEVIDLAVKNFCKNQRLPDFLSATKMSFSEFARYSGLSRVWISKILGGKKPLRKAFFKIQSGVEFINIQNSLFRKEILRIEALLSSDIALEKVVTKKELFGVKQVYDLSIQGNPNYLANGIVVHNCGRNKKPEIALAVCLGDRAGGYGEALALMDAHRNNLRQGIEFIQKHGIEERKSFYFFDAGEAIDESIVGIIAGMLYGSIISENKPIIALARNTDGTIKLSGRGTSELVRRGLNLGKALKEIGAEIEGVEGGGHFVAAGAKIPAEKLDEFLEILEKKLIQQISLK